jgi:hypothetical protein
VEVYYPTPGTRAAELCRESGWVSGRGEEGYWNQASTLDMPSLPAERINELAVELPYAVRHGRSSRLMRLLAGIRVTRRRSLYDILHPPRHSIR